ncbi:MAG: hypothetical protein HQL09_02780 [Nitrospirae bacterium]|nr:hypothetical protein [Nitrospirota bacterium]
MHREMKEVVIVSRGSFVSSTFIRRFPNCDINIIPHYRLQRNAYEDKYNLIVPYVSSEEIPAIQEPLKMMCQKLMPPIVAVTDSFVGVSKELAELGLFTIFVKPVDAETIVSLAGAYCENGTIRYA